MRQRWKPPQVFKPRENPGSVFRPSSATTRRRFPFPNGDVPLWPHKRSHEPLRISTDHICRRAPICCPVSRITNLTVHGPPDRLLRNREARPDPSPAYCGCPPTSRPEFRCPAREVHLRDPVHRYRVEKINRIITVVLRIVKHVGHIEKKSSNRFPR